VNDATQSESAADIQRIIESARRLGVEIDESATVQWLTAMAAAEESDQIVVDTASGTFGHKVSMLDFSPRDLERFRRIGAIVEVTGPEGTVESALALSGSAAQSKIQSFPGDCDYFERLNIKADTRDEACAIMAGLMRDKVLSTLQGPTYQFLEAKLGTFGYDCTQNGDKRWKGSPITWKSDDITAGIIDVVKDDGTAVTLRWDEVALDPGWCKLDWVVADPSRRQLSNASNVIDVTWEAPDGNIVSLDGYLDAFFQEVYLDADDVPQFAKLAKFVSDDALDEYVDRLEGEVRKYLTDHLNYGKAAKRMYNVFRLSGRHLDAAFVRELFDEPTTILYQVWSLIVTLENATEPGSAIPIEAVQAQADTLVADVAAALEGDQENEIVRALLRLRRTLEDQQSGEARSAEVEAAQTQVVNLINTFYRDKLVAMPSIKEYIDGIQAAQAH
jgi:anion-transporting  ArsA/GET3 family ATPase